MQMSILAPNKIQLYRWLLHVVTNTNDMPFLLEPAFGGVGQLKLEGKTIQSTGNVFSDRPACDTTQRAHLPTTPWLLS